ncbi:MAG: hypothetical protein QW657_04150, partial [Candidatus Bathyarchaeia archaeon]
THTVITNDFCNFHSFYNDRGCCQKDACRPCKMLSFVWSLKIVYGAGGGGMRTSTGITGPTRTEEISHLKKSCSKT